MIQVSKQLLQKHDRPGPRYTSYPPANHFHEGVKAGDYVRELGRVGAREPLSIYVHVPFCERRCTYCGCYSIPTQRHDVSRKYLDYCLKELEMVRGRLESPARVAAVHLGGGTPTYLRPQELKELLGRIAGQFELTEDVEVSVELDPRVTTEEHLDALVETGTNRVSMGIQDTAEDVQEAIGRFQGRDESIRFFGLCRKKGFESVNVDLVYGLPRQRPEGFRATLRDMLALRPDRFAIFGYAHVPWVRPNQEKINPAELPKAEARLELYMLAHAELTGSGYRHIGMDHFALPDDDLSRAQEEGRLGRNFMGYTPRRYIKILGIGVSSIGDLTSGYFQNEKKLSTYYASLDRGEFPIERGFLVSPDDLVRRYVIHEILCNLKVSYADFEERFHLLFSEYFAVEMGDIADLERDGLVETSSEWIRVTPAGTLLLRNIAMPFDRYLRERPPAQATYSRTV